MKLITQYADNNYPIIVRQNALDELNALLASYKDVIFIVDDTVYSYWQSRINHVATDVNASICRIPAGETVKTFAHYTDYIEKLLARHLTRQTCFVAIGGGATGDFVGFLAATILRGVDFIQVPTTILAHDSSIGGKVGINTSQGKNLVGAFYRPKAVLYDLTFLETLPYAEVLSGYAELYKHALLNNIDFLNELEATYTKESDFNDRDQLSKHIMLGIKTKYDIVLADEKEHGRRKFLNLGHTFGHAIEYTHKMAHGHAVMIGIVYQFLVSNKLLNTTFDVSHYFNYLKQLGYPLTIIQSFDFDTLYQLMLSDKKNDMDGIQMVLLSRIGQPEMHHVPKHILEDAYETLLNLRK